MVDEHTEVLTVAEAAAFLRISAYQLRIYAAKGTVPAKKVGGVWRFLKSKLIRYMEQG